MKVTLDLLMKISSVDMPTIFELEFAPFIRIEVSDLEKVEH